MKIHLRILEALCLCLLALACPLRAQNGKFYSTEHGLSSSLVNHLLQDDRGYVWIATEYGLNRFDGIQFATYYHNDKDSTSLTSNYVHTLFEDSQKRLYVGCIDGLARYRRETDDFQPIPLLNGRKPVKAHVTHIIETDGGETLISTTGQGLFRLDADGRQARFISEEWNIDNYAYLSYIYEDRQHNVWIGTDGDGLKERPAQAHTTLLYRQPALPDLFATRLMEDGGGTLFVGTLYQGLFRLAADGKGFAGIPLDGKQSNYAVMALACVDGQLLAGTDGQGLRRYDGTVGRLTDMEMPSSPINLSDAKVHAIMQDRDGNLWLGLFQKGIVFIPRQTNPFAYYGPRTAYHNPIGNSCVMSVFSDSRHHLWVGTDHDGLYELDAQGRQLRHYAAGSVPSTIMCIAEDSRHQLWLGSYGEGMALLDPLTGRCSYPAFLQNTVVMSIVEDDDQHLYIATMAHGMYRYSLTDGRWTQYSSSRDGKQNPRRNEMANDWVNRVYRDSQGRIWLGHYTGISCFDPKARSFTALNGRNRIVENCITYALLDDGQGTLWAGTSEGLCRIDMATGQHTFLTVDDGLCDNVIKGICRDAKGCLWLSSFRGMTKYDPSTGACSNFYAGDGLQGNEFTNGAYYQDADGRCYFGGVNGVTAFQPAEVTENERPLTVWVTEFCIDNLPVRSTTLSNGHPIIDTSVEDAHTFRLSHLDNSFSLTFSTLQYDNAEKIGYRYRLDGINSQWILTEPGVSRIQYNKLPSGSYTLRVQALLRGQLSEERTFRILIASPWYQTGWAYALYALILGLLAWAVASHLRARVRQKRQLVERQHAEQINEAKLQFFINIAHEIRTPMTLIISPIEKLLASEPAGERYTTYQMIHRNAQRILRLINQLMDVRKLDKGQMEMHFSPTDLVDFIRQGMEPFQSLAEKKHITLTFHHATDSLTAWIDPNNFDKVMNNVASNAFKFTPEGGRVDVTLSTVAEEGRDYGVIAVADTGIGIDPSQLERIFDRFYQVDNAVTKHSIGTGVGLHLARQLMTLHHGTIHAERRTDGPGSLFIIRLPLGKEHLKPEELEADTFIPIVTAPVIDTPDSTAYGETTRRTQALPLILVAEDDEEIAHYLREELQADYRVTTCSNGKEALESALRNRPDLVISDVMMPEMDGFTLCRKLKQNTEVNHVPVVLLTAKTREEDTREGMDLGADAYMTKPFSIGLLRATIGNLLNNRHLLRTKFSGAQQQQDKVERLEMKSADEELMERIMKVINRHMDDPDLSVEMLSQEVGISRVHIHRKMKELTHQTTRDFIKNIRLQQAATLMTENAALTVSEVAYKVGFSNLSHFSTSFKEKYGVSPKEYLGQGKQLPGDDE
jgi:signal transduction histidine kinase/ligand-binding sensor domain-containing protein/DNA-binding response OmpR family regulator